MTRVTTVQCERVKFIPADLESGKIYYSKDFSTAVHLCCCGCGNSVVTPIGPTDWRITVARNAVSISPSIGNWSFPCQSHYWIRDNKVVWATQMSRREIEHGRAADRIAKEQLFSYKQPSLWRRFVDWILGKIH